MGERDRGWGVSAGRFKWGECNEWGAREREREWRELGECREREWSERSESEWGERMGKCKWGRVE